MPPPALSKTIGEVPFAVKVKGIFPSEPFTANIGLLPVSAFDIVNQLTGVPASVKANIAFVPSPILKPLRSRQTTPARSR